MTTSSSDVAALLGSQFGCVTADETPSIPLYLTTETLFRQFESQQKSPKSWPEEWKTWLESCAWKAKQGKSILIPRGDHSIEAALAVIPEPFAPNHEAGNSRSEAFAATERAWCLSHLPAALPPLRFVLDFTYLTAESTGEQLSIDDLKALVCSWAAAHIPPANWKARQSAPKLAKLVWPEALTTAARQEVLHRIRGRQLARHLIDLPASHLAPLDLAEFAQSAMAAEGNGFCDETAQRFASCSTRIITGSELEEGYPAIHAVGHGSDRLPALFEASWIGAKHGPTLTIIGKGIVFDTGGYNLKPGNSMRLMKKDMGGAAVALALAWMCIAAGLPVRLRLLIPCAENSISGRAMRPGDIIATRKGLSVEIGNTDAEGRLVLADALAAATEEADGKAPKKQAKILRHRVIDFATLTGAARVALGTDIPVLFCNDELWATEWAEAAQRSGDMIWRLPLWPGYEKAMKGKRADLDNDGSMGGYGGAITAALFLKSFVPEGAEWSHIDLMAYNTRTQSGRPEGGEAQGLMSAFESLQTWCHLNTDQGEESA